MERIFKPVDKSIYIDSKKPKKPQESLWKVKGEFSHILYFCVLSSIAGIGMKVTQPALVLTWYQKHKLHYSCFLLVPDKTQKQADMHTGLYCGRKLRSHA